MDRRGFGLLEILIVVAIVALLAGGGIYLKYFQQSQNVAQVRTNAIQQAEQAGQLVETQTSEEQNSISQIDQSATGTPAAPVAATPVVASSSNSSALTQTELLAMAGDPYANGILPLGDGKYTTSAPKKGYVYLCNVAQGGGGAENNGPWIGTSTWNSNEKISVEGSVSWPQAYVHITVDGSTRTIASNDLPTTGVTGIFPIQQSDPAYQYDTNPNSIEAQNLSVSLPANPSVAPTPSCIYGEVGIMTNGVLLLDAFDAEYRDAAAHEILDSCDGHPHEDGMYHYHDLSSCIPDAMETNVIGWAFDGFPITGPEVAPGKYLTTADLDECHGITSAVDINGTMVDTYHYVMTQDFPYSVSCFRGKSYEPKPAANGQMNMSGMQMSGSSNAGSNGGQTPPQAAIDACSSKSLGSSCSFSTPNGSLSGLCNQTPGGTIACVPN